MEGLQLLGYLLLEEVREVAQLLLLHVDSLLIISNEGIRCAVATLRLKFVLIWVSHI